MRAPSRLVHVALSVGLALGMSSACKKKKKEEPTAAPVTPAPAKPAGMDKVAAERALMPHVWTGVLQGKPLKLYVAKVGDKAAAVLRFGEVRLGGLFTLSSAGKFTLASRPRPTAQGLESIRFNLQVAPDFSALRGTAQRSSKQGFVEQSSGLGEFALAKGPALKGAPILSPQPKGSFGAAVGLRLWDELIELDGKKVNAGDAVQTPTTVGKEVKLVVMRNGERVLLEGTVPPPMKPAMPASGAQPAKTAQPTMPVKPAPKAASKKDEDDE